MAVFLWKGRVGEFPSALCGEMLQSAEGTSMRSAFCEQSIPVSEVKMKVLQGRELNAAAALLVGCIVAVPQTVVAQNHVVSPGEMQKDVSAASAARQHNQQEVQDFLSTKEAQRAMKSANIDPQQVTTAISQLNDAELASLAARSAKAQKDFAAGNIDNHDLLLILVGLAALILIIVAVH